jgi:hypothetical protein
LVGKLVGEWVGHTTSVERSVGVTERAIRPKPTVSLVLSVAVEGRTLGQEVNALLQLGLVGCPRHVEIIKHGVIMTTSASGL